MYPSEHPTTALVLARYRMEEDIARAEAYRAAKAARRVRNGRRPAQSNRGVGRSPRVRLYAAVRGALGRT
jgi:hypothetical protein